MISCIIIDHGHSVQKTVANFLNLYCPYVQVNGIAHTLDQGRHLLHRFESDLLFFNPRAGSDDLMNISHFNSNRFHETIVIAGDQRPEGREDKNIAGYLQIPIQAEEFILAMNNALYHILENKQPARQNKLIKKMYKVHCTNEIVGIPTVEGYEFIEVNSIVRCEGLQKCTRVVTTERSNIVSSYNLGEFIRLLSPFEFFSPHKSHLINLNMVRKYHKEGTIYMQDGSHLPVARRRKDDFLLAVNHL